MPVPLLGEMFFGGLDAIPYTRTVLKVIPWIILAYLIKRWSSGAVNGSERNMHGKVVLMTVSCSHLPKR